MSNLVENCFIKPGYSSDHSIVLLEIKFNPFNRGRGLWKFNNSSLTDNVYVQKLKGTIQSECRQYLDNCNSTDFQCKEVVDEILFFGVLMMEIRGATISYSLYRKKRKDNLEKKLLQEIDFLESDLDINFNRFERKKVALENLRKEYHQGHMIRSRVRWIEEGEKPSNIFAIWGHVTFLIKPLEGTGTVNEQA